MLSVQKGVVALALTSSLAKAAAFYCSRSRRSPSHIIPRNRSTSAVSDNTPHASVNEYELLKKSRPFRIHARLIPTNGEKNSIVGSSEATKIVHFQRHAQGTHNAIYKEWTDRTGKPLDLSETDPRKNPLLLPDVTDAPLTQKGRDQCEERRAAASALEGIELIIMSPLVRCLQTAHITFEDHLPRNTPRGVKWMAHEGVREELGTLLCNKRRPLSETERLFPGVDFTRLPCGEDDAMWEKHVEKNANDDGTPARETTEDMSHRCYDFLVEFLRSRPEREMVVVGHSAWLLAMTNAVLDAGGDGGLIAPMFDQAELRSMELVFAEQQQGQDASVACRAGQ